MKPSAADPYCYPGTNLLRNLGDFHHQAGLDAFEAASVGNRLAQLLRQPLTGPFNLTRLKETHRSIFQDVYAWAGQIRQHTGALYKQRATGTVVAYPDPTYIQAAIEDLFRKLHKENSLRGLTLEAFALRAAHFYGELDAAHPFREGNSRTLRQFFTDLARDAGFALSWSHLAHDESGRNSLYQARDLAALKGDSSALARILEAGLHPLQPGGPS